MTSPLGQPLTLPCGARLSNRLAKSAMSEQLGTVRNTPTEKLAQLYSRWADGGVGLSITGNVMIDPAALGEPRNVVLDEGSFAEARPAFEAWARAGSQPGSAIWMQLNHPGRQSPRHLSRQPVAPSAVRVRVARGAFAVPRALTGAEIETIIDRFAQAAGLAQAAGFDGVQIHGAHGYLVSQFLSPHTNRRTDRWGGDPQRRMRFVLEVLAGIRDRVGTRFPVGIKLNSADFQRGGFSHEESLEVVEQLAGAGIDLVEVSGGTYESAVMVGRGRATRRSTEEREAYFLEYAQAVRERVRVPLMVTGGFRTRAGMEQAVTQELVQLVGLARPLCVEPDLPRQLIDATVDDSESRPLPVRSRHLAGMAEIVWHTQQIHRIAAGLEPQPDRSPWRSLAQALVLDSASTARRLRLRR